METIIDRLGRLESIRKIQNTCIYNIRSPGKFVPMFKEFGQHETSYSKISKLRERWKKVYGTKLHLYNSINVYQMEM